MHFLKLNYLQTDLLSIAKEEETIMKSKNNYFVDTMFKFCIADKKIGISLKIHS